MAIFTDQDVAQYANLYARDDPVTATAVALAEHGGVVSTTAVGRNSNGTIDVGVWQINSVHRRDHPEWTEAWLKDPKHNAEAMSVVSSGGSNWSPWSTYKAGKHRAYMDRAAKAVDATSGRGGTLDAVTDAAGSIVSNPLDAVADVAGSVSQLAESIGGFFEWLTDPDTWRRVVLVVAGAGVVLVGVSVVARGTEVGETVENVVSKGRL